MPAIKAPIASLSPAEREWLSEAINYLNTAELQRFCAARIIPYKIYVETDNGRFVPTRDADRKGVIIDRVLHFLRTGIVKAQTTFRKPVISTKKLNRPPVEADQVLYGRYKNHDPAILALMKALTDGKFEFGAVAQEVLRGCWSRNEAPSYREFARLWQKAAREYSKPNPEWAFLNDRTQGKAGRDWKTLRTRKAKAVIDLLNRIARLPLACH